MVRRSAASKARVEGERRELESELGKYEQMARDLRRSDESKLVKTGKQKIYHKKIIELKGKLEHLN